MVSDRFHHILVNYKAQLASQMDELKDDFLILLVLHRQFHQLLDLQNQYRHYLYLILH